MNIKKLFLSELSFFISVPALLWQFFFLYIPLTFIVYLSFFSKDVSGFTLNNYITFFSWPYAVIILRSFMLAFSNGIVTLVLSYPVAYFLAFHVKKWKNAFLFFMILPFWTNLLVQVYAWSFVLEPYGVLNTFLLQLGVIETPLYLLNSMFSVFLGMIYCYIPFMVVPLYSALETIDHRLLEASSDLGASHFETFRRITLPLSFPGIRTGFFLVFIPSFGEFIIPSLLGGGRRMYVGTLISHYFLILQDSFRGAAFTVVSGIILLIAIFLVHYCLMRSVTFFAGKGAEQ